MTTHNEDMAASVGQDSTDHELTEVYDKHHGKYAPQPAAVGSTAPVSNETSPFASLK